MPLKTFHFIFYKNKKKKKANEILKTGLSLHKIIDFNQKK